MKRTFVAALALASFAMLTLSPRVEAIPLLSVGSATMNVGNTFTVPILVSGATDLMSFQFDLSYDDTILTVLSFTDVGTDFDNAATAGGGFLTGITGFSFSGLLSGVTDSMSGALTGLTGSGVVANIEFEAIASSTSPLTLSNVFLNFSDTGFDVTNGEVCVDSPSAPTCPQAAPEPGTVALLAMGLAVLTLRRRWTSMR